MAIGTPTSLGTPGTASGSGTTVAFNTSVTVPSAAKLIIGVTWYNAVTASMGGGGLSWALSQQQNAAVDANYRVALLSADAPSGLASGTTLTATYSGGAFARSICGFDVTGLQTTSYEDVGSGNSANNSASAVWTTGNVATTNADDLLVGHAWLDFRTGTNTPDGTDTEIHDFTNAGEANQIAMEYRIVSSTGSYDLGGTWVAGANYYWVATVVAYKALAVPTPPNIEEGFAAPAGMFSPTLLEKGWFY